MHHLISLIFHALSHSPFTFLSKNQKSKSIHAVDLNPNQNNLLELKLASISALKYSEFWKLFGEGYLSNFSSIVSERLSPYLSSSAHHYWHHHSDFSNLYLTGGSGLAIRIFRLIVKARGLGPSVTALCTASSLKEQTRVWNEEIRPYVLSPFLWRLLNNHRFLWGALGVPPNQSQMLLNEGSLLEFARNTFDPLASQSSLRNDNYFYYQPLMGSYLPDCCPSYLKEKNFEALKRDNGDLLQSIQIQLSDSPQKKSLPSCCPYRRH